MSLQKNIINNLYHKKYGGRVCYLLSFFYNNDPVLKIGSTYNLFPNKCPIMGNKTGRIYQLCNDVIHHNITKQIDTNFNIKCAIVMVFKEKDKKYPVIRSFEQVFLNETKKYHDTRYPSEYRLFNHIDEIFQIGKDLQKEYKQYISIRL